MSAILSADDLNDFISPGVACIKPIETLPAEEKSNPYEVTTEDKVQPQNPAPASISLTDCLACSGCVTSAEAVLVSLQSHTEVLNTLDSHPSIDCRRLFQQNGVNSHVPSSLPSSAKLFVASVSPQVRASIAATYGISMRRAGNMITQFLSGSQGLRIGGVHNNGFAYVLDTNRLREACLVLGADEVSKALADKSQPRPILTSACPGWICYAEKTHPHVLPHLSTLKSPQAMTGTLVKSILSKALDIHPSQIWHLAIMPCFDKKLEASREELTNQWWSDITSSSPVRDVDCVITSRELLTLAEARGIQLSTLPQIPLPRSERQSFPNAALSRFLFSERTTSASQSPDASSSGGYLYHILRTQQALHRGSTISTVRGRNADVVEYTLTNPSSPNKPILKCARYYGFRNIQNLVRKLKPARISKLPGAAAARKLPSRQRDDNFATDYAYVEVMACPGGCTNGGGQIKIDDVADIIPQTRGEEVQRMEVEVVTTSLSDETAPASTTQSALRLPPQSQKEWLARIDEAYYSATDSGTDSDDMIEDNDTDANNDANGHTQNNNYNKISNNTNVLHPNTQNGDERKIVNDDKSTETVIVNGINTSYIHQILESWSQFVDIPLDKLVYTSFRQVESDVGKKKTANKNLGDAERIAAIAGLSGGGW